MSLIRRLPVPLVLLGVCAGGLRAEVIDAPVQAGNWYVTLGAAQAPEIEEEASGPGGTSSYDWIEGADDYAPRLAVGYLTCAGGLSGGWALAGELVLTTCDATPERYEVGGLAFANTSSSTLRYSTLGATVSGGYQFGLEPDFQEDSINAMFLVMPFLGGGMAYADSEMRDQNGTYAKDSGIGWYVEAGLRLGFLLCEKNWLGGVLVDIGYGSGEVEVDFGGGTSSTLTHERVGLGASLVVGYRL